jgi:hypothetical protein
VHEFNTPTDNLLDAGMTNAWVAQGIKDQALARMNYISAQVPKYALTFRRPCPEART